MPTAPRSDAGPAENNWQQAETHFLDNPHLVEATSTPPAPPSQPARTRRTRSQGPEAEAQNTNGLHPPKQSPKFHPQSGPVLPSPTCPTPISRPANVKRKRHQDLEAEAEADKPRDERPIKQPRRSTPPSLDSAEAEEPPLLSKDESEALKSTFEDVMASAANNSPSGSIRRTPSQQSLSTQGSRTSASTNGRYRLEVLARAQIKIHANPPPREIQDAIDAIVYASPSQARREELKSIAREFQARCLQAAKASVGENDFVKIFHDALDAMHIANLCLRTNADWNDQLKPRIQHSPYNVGSLRRKGGRQQQAVDGSAPPPAKRLQQSGGHPYISPQPSTANTSNPPPANGPQAPATVPPFAPPPIPEKDATIKTPRPDITIGLLRDSLVSALSSQDLNEVDALLFLDDLQTVLESSEPEGWEEPILISAPAPRASDLVFPFAVDEGKAYLTGRQIAEAENQAAASGACAINMQLRLDELVKRNTAAAEASTDQQPSSTDSDRGRPAPARDQGPELAPPSEPQIPLFFPICTEGPLHMLWVMWTEVRHGKRQYNMMPLRSVYGTLFEGLVEFFVMVDNVLRWGTGHFLESLVERLGKVARKTTQAGLVVGEIEHSSF